MRIGDNNSIYAIQAKAQATNPNFVYKTRNSQGLTGMEITGTTAADRKIVPVSDDIKEKLTSLAKNIFLENYGMNDGEEMSALMRKYIASSPEKQRTDVAWTLHQVWLNEYERIENTVKENIPGWQVGKSFDRNFVNDLISKSSIDQIV